MRLLSLCTSLPEEDLRLKDDRASPAALQLVVTLEWFAQGSTIRQAKKLFELSHETVIKFR